jgi:hypothetical protein
MRIILWLAAGMAVSTIATEAPARPGGTGSGHGASSPGARSDRGYPGAKRVHFGIGPAKPDRGHGPNHGRFGRRGYQPYGGGIAGPVGQADPWGNGFFTRRGGRIGLRGGQPHYEYDRTYPYEWASTAGGGEQLGAPEERATEAPPRCTFEIGVRVCRGW